MELVFPGKMGVEQLRSQWRITGVHPPFSQSQEWQHHLCCWANQSSRDCSWHLLRLILTVFPENQFPSTISHGEKLHFSVPLTQWLVLDNELWAEGMVVTSVWKHWWVRDDSLNSLNPNSSISHFQWRVSISLGLWGETMGNKVHADMPWTWNLKEELI